MHHENLNIYNHKKSATTSKALKWYGRLHHAVIFKKCSQIIVNWQNGLNIALKILKVGPKMIKKTI